MAAARKRSSTKTPATLVEPSNFFAVLSSTGASSASGASEGGEAPGRDATLDDGEAPGRDATLDDGEAPGGDPTLDDGAAPATIGTTPAGGTATLDDGAALATSGTTSAGCSADASPQKSAMCVSASSDMHCYNCASEIYGIDFVKQGTYFKCGDCNRLSGRIRRTLAKQHELTDSWNLLGKDEKKAFYLANHKAMGTGLALAIDETIKNSFSQTSRSTFEAEGSWLDEIDVREMFKDKIDQRDSILKFGKTLQCPVRNCQLFEVMAYKSKASDEQEATRSRSVTCSQSSGRKAMKESTGEPKEKKQKLQPVPAMLNDPSLTKLAKLTQKLTEKLVILAAMLKVGTDNQVPDKIMQNLSLHKANMEEAKSLIDMAIESKHGKFTDLSKQANTIILESIEAAKNVQTVLDALGAVELD
jgi:hypothetical protein